MDSICRRILTFCILLAIITVIITFIFIFANIPKSVRSDIGDAILPLLLHHDTKFSNNYDELKFRSIQKGFTKKEVETLIGKPLKKKSINDEEYWWYSESPTNTNFHHRLIVFSFKGEVKKIASEFYLD